MSITLGNVSPRNFNVQVSRRPLPRTLPLGQLPPMKFPQVQKKNKQKLPLNNSCLTVTPSTIDPYEIRPRTITSRTFPPG